MCASLSLSPVVYEERVYLYLYLSSSVSLYLLIVTVASDRFPQIVGLIWDGASTDTREFGRGVIKFPLGQRLVPVGLEQAIVQVMIIAYV